jgi:hypothetical protein
MSVEARGANRHDGAEADRLSEYETDILVWSEHQAKLLRRRASGELVEDTELDWQNIAQEIEDVGSNRLHAVESLLVQALRYMLKAEAWPLSRDAPTWRADAIDFRLQARRRFVPSMRQKIDIAGLYADTLAAIPASIDDQPPLPIQTPMPTLDDLLSEK